MSIGTIIRRRREELSLTQDQVALRVGISKPYLSNIETGKVKNPPTDAILEALERVLEFSSGELTRVAHLARTPVDVREEHEMLEAQVNKLRSVVRELLAGSRRKGGTEVEGEGETLRLDEDSIAEENASPLSAGVIVPVINKVAAGYPAEFTDLDYPPSVADEYIRCPDLHDAQAFATRVVGDSMEPRYREGDVVVFSPNTPAESGDDCFVRFAEDGGTTFKRLYVDDERTLRLQPLNNLYPARICRAEEITGLWPAVYRMERLRD
jgi:phage repressor protein C with HTH and peptisase S24 domain